MIVVCRKWPGGLQASLVFGLSSIGTPALEPEHASKRIAKNFCGRTVSEVQAYTVYFRRPALIVMNPAKVSA